MELLPKTCDWCKYNGSISQDKPCENCSRAYKDRWEVAKQSMTVEEAIEFLFSSHVFSVLSKREKEALNVLIEEAQE